MSSTRLKIAAALAVLFALVGCATQKDIADQAIKANLAIENSGNRMLLLNVVRAYHQRPMHFSSISKVSGPIGVISPSTSLAIPFGPDFKTQVYTLTPTLKADTPVFDVAPLDTQDFLRGITTPTPLSLVKYYLDQGWPIELALSLFVRRFDFYDKNVVTGEWMKSTTQDPIVNYPPNREQFHEFEKALGDLVKCGMEIEGFQSRIGPSVAKDKLDASQQISLAKEKFSAQKVETNSDGTPSSDWALYRAELDYRFVFYKRDKPDCQHSVWKKFVKKPADKTASQNKNLARAELHEKESLVRVESPDGLSSLTTSFRSPEAMLYYLGELARVQSRKVDSYVPKIAYRDADDGSANTVPLFVLNRGKSVGSENAAAVEYDGDTYAIPAGDEGGQSMHALSLVNQLIDLQKKATDLPTTNTVRIIGQ